MAADYMCRVEKKYSSCCSQLDNGKGEVIWCHVWHITGQAQRVDDWCIKCYFKGRRTAPERNGERDKTMSETRLLMLKDTPVLETKGFEVRVLDFDHLPFQLRHDHVSFDHIYHGWTETRVLPIGRTNAKKILAGFGIRQNSAYAIASKMHFA